jgi:D-glycero-D-manno-heptose 1,7-bisphosphate phosphatase
MLSWRAANARSGMPALFLDRDGVLNRSIPGGYALSTADVAFNDDVIAALGALAPERRMVIVSNQSCVGRGLLGVPDLRAIMAHVVDGAARRGLPIDAWYCCPHAPDDGCACRKPKPGMLIAAARDLGIDLRSAAFVGDQPSDVAAAEAAGVRPLPIRPDDAADVRAHVAALRAGTRA